MSTGLVSAPPQGSHWMVSTCKMTGCVFCSYAAAVMVSIAFVAGYCYFESCEDPDEWVISVLTLPALGVGFVAASIFCFCGKRPCDQPTSSYTEV